MRNSWGKLVDKLRIRVGKNCVRLSTSRAILKTYRTEPWGQPLVFRPIFPTFPPSFSSPFFVSLPQEYRQFSPVSTVPIIRATK